MALRARKVSGAFEKRPPGGQTFAAPYPTDIVVLKWHKPKQTLNKVVFYWDQPFLVGWVGWDWGKTVFGWFGWSTFSTDLKPGWNGWKNICLIMLRDCSSHNDYSQELSRFNQKRLEKCSFEKGQPYQPKPVDPNTTRPNFWGKTPNVTARSQQLFSLARVSLYLKRCDQGLPTYQDAKG